MIKTYKDGSRGIVEHVSYEVNHIRLGKDLNFIDKLILTDGTVIQNMQYELNAEVPTPTQLAQMLKQPDTTTGLHIAITIEDK